jgi:hypothetical protein
VWVHTAAYIHNEEIIHSCTHGHGARESFYGLVTCDGRQRVVEVSYFVRLERPGKQPLRLAVCNLFKEQESWSDPDYGTMLLAKVYPGDMAATCQLCSWGIGLSAIDTKVMAADDVKKRRQPHTMCFLTTGNASGLH